MLIVRNEDTGETKQVGRSCVKDFLGWSTMPVLIDPEQAEQAIQHGGGIDGHSWDLASVLTYSWAVIETHGWVPASNAGNRTATRDLVAEAIAAAAATPTSCGPRSPANSTEGQPDGATDRHRADRGVRRRHQRL